MLNLIKVRFLGGGGGGASPLSPALDETLAKEYLIIPCYIAIAHACIDNNIDTYSPQ